MRDVPKPSLGVWCVPMALACALASCADGSADEEDGGGAGSGDAAAPDAGPAPDDAGGALDAGPAPGDGGGALDAGPAPGDGGALDAGPTPGDGGGARDAGTGGDAGEECVPGECCYELVHESPGVFHTVVEGDSQHIVRPLEPGEGFFCMRIEYTMQTVDNLVETDEAYDGCPIFSHIAGIQGSGADGRVVNGAFFRMLRLGCSVRRPVAVQLDVWAPPGESRSTTLTGPWLPGETYRIVHEVVPFTSSIELSQDGATVGPIVETDISGTTVDMTRDTEVVFGLDGVHEGAYFPYFDAVYSDLEIWADVAAAP